MPKLWLSEGRRAVIAIYEFRVQLFRKCAFSLTDIISQGEAHAMASDVLEVERTK